MKNNLIEVLGPGCKNCDDLYDNVLKALEQAGLTERIEVEKKKDIDVDRLVPCSPGRGHSNNERET